MKKKFSFPIQITVFFILLLFLILLSASIGSADLSIKDSLLILLSRIPFLRSYLDISQISDVYETIVWKVRMPRIFLSVLTGGNLAVVGACFQGLFRNPLADPHILGISSGAALGATFAILSGIQISFLGLGVIGIFAFIGALITILFVYQISCTNHQVSITSLLLTGTAINSMLSALISLLMSLNRDKIKKVYLWTLGSFSSATWSKVQFLFLFSILGICILCLFSKALDMISLGEETAQSLGVDTKMVKKIVIVISSLLVGACVCVSGIIGFVGLIIPHCIRIIRGSSHRFLLPLCAIAGAIFMLICDTLARTIASPSEIPVGVITSIFGAPYFIFLLKYNKKTR